MFSGAGHGASFWTTSEKGLSDNDRKEKTDTVTDRFKNIESIAAIHRVLSDGQQWVDTTPLSADTKGPVSVVSRPIVERISQSSPL